MKTTLYKKYLRGSSTQCYVYKAEPFFNTELPEGAIRIKQGLYSYKIDYDTYYFLDRSSPLFNMELVDTVTRIFSHPQIANKVDLLIAKIFGEYVKP